MFVLVIPCYVFYRNLSLSRTSSLQGSLILYSDLLKDLIYNISAEQFTVPAEEVFVRMSELNLQPYEPVRLCSRTSCPTHKSFSQPQHSSHINIFITRLTKANIQITLSNTTLFTRKHLHHTRNYRKRTHHGPLYNIGGTYDLDRRSTAEHAHINGPLSCFYVKVIKTLLLQ